MKHALILLLGTLAPSAFAEGTDPLAAKLQALEQGKIPSAQKTPPPPPTPTPTAPAMEKAQASVANTQSQVATRSQAEPHCEVKKPLAHVKKNPKPTAKRKPKQPEKETLQASLSPILFEPVSTSVPDPAYEIPAHGDLLQKRLARESIEEEPGSLLEGPVGAKIEVSSDRLSFTQERDFRGHQTLGLEFLPDPTPRPRSEQRK